MLITSITVIWKAIRTFWGDSHTTLAYSPFSPAATKPHTICSTYDVTQSSGSLPPMTNNVICGLHGVGIGLGQQKRISSSYLFCYKIDLYTEDINTPLTLVEGERHKHISKQSWKGTAARLYEHPPLLSESPLPCSVCKDTAFSTEQQA